MPSWLKQYDIFMSYAYEDKHIARALSDELRKKGISVWFVGERMRIGSVIAEEVDEGLKHSRYGIVIAGKDHAASGWGSYEYRHMMSSYADESILPVWHKLNYDEKRLLYPELINTYGPSTDEEITAIAAQVEEFVNKKQQRYAAIAALVRLCYRNRSRVGTILIFILFFLFACIVFCYVDTLSPSKEEKKAAILDRARETFVIADNVVLDHDSLQKLRTRFDRLKNVSSHRHYYSFTNGAGIIKNKVGIREQDIPLDEYTTGNAYGLQRYKVCISQVDTGPDYRLIYTFINLDTCEYKVTSEKTVNGNFCISVTYSHRVRAVKVDCRYDRASATSSEHVSYYGFKPSEEVSFEKRNDRWVPLPVY